MTPVKTPYTDRIRRKLTTAYAPHHLDIVDESHKHARHAGAHAEGETHFRVRIISASFQGLSRLERQRHVYTLLADEMAERVHALSLILQTPAEAQETL